MMVSDESFRHRTAGLVIAGWVGLMLAVVLFRDLRDHPVVQSFATTVNAAAVLVLGVVLKGQK